MKTGTVTLAVLGLAAPATAVSCGLSSGYDKGTAAYYFNNNGSLANFASCSSLCLSQTKCESFAIGDSQCLLYADPLYVGTVVLKTSNINSVLIVQKDQKDVLTRSLCVCPARSDDNFRYQANSPFLFYDRDCAYVQSTSSFMTTMPATSTVPSSNAAAASATGTAAGKALVQTTSTASGAAATSTSASAAGPGLASSRSAASAAAAAALLFSLYVLG
jgi:hypothetical protein